jgi:hypothetical protein
MGAELVENASTLCVLQFLILISECYIFVDFTVSLSFWQIIKNIPWNLLLLLDASLYHCWIIVEGSECTKVGNIEAGVWSKNFMISGLDNIKWGYGVSECAVRDETIDSLFVCQIFVFCFSNIPLNTKTCVCLDFALFHMGTKHLMIWWVLCHLRTCQRCKCV